MPQVCKECRTELVDIDRTTGGFKCRKCGYAVGGVEGEMKKMKMDPQGRVEDEEYGK